MKREQWKSKLGFMWAAIGSAVGLGSIWRFPYVVGQSGGSAFVLLFAFCLIIVSLPVLFSEVYIGKTTQKSPEEAFRRLTDSKWWGRIGVITIFTGVIVSAFYSVVVGWTLGYFIDAVLGRFSTLSTSQAAESFFIAHSRDISWILSMHALLLFSAFYILYRGIQHGIEAWNKLLMPLLLVLLVILSIRGLFLEKSHEAIAFLLNFDLTKINHETFLLALGQAFFGVSIGQGTMVTYGSYLSKKENVLRICVPIVTSIVIVSLLAGLAIFPVVFSAGIPPNSGPDLIFRVLPMVFANMAGGTILAVVFFLATVMAGLTSQISAMQPLIAWLQDRFKISLKSSAFIATMLTWIIGVPAALTFSGHSVFQFNVFHALENISVNYLVPMGGLSATLIVGYVYGIRQVHKDMKLSSGKTLGQAITKNYLTLAICAFAPTVIVIIFVNAIFFN